MGLTNFPNGISTRATSAANTAAGDGDFNCLDMFVDGTATITGGQTFTGAASFSSTLTIGSGTGIIGSYSYIPAYFAVSSAVQQISVPVPYAGELDAVTVFTGSVASVAAGYTVRVGSAGSIAVATVTNTTAVVGAGEALTTTATTFGALSALVCIRSVQGTAGDTSIILAVRRTA